MAYNIPKLTGTVNQVAITQTATGQTVSIATPTVISTQPAFFADLSTGLTDVTGDGTAYLIIFDNELSDQGSNYNPATGLFTAPVTGKYLFTCTITLTGILVAHTSNIMDFVATGITYMGVQNNPFATTGAAISCAFSVIAAMVANDTIQPRVTISGGTKVVDVNSGTTNSYFSGALIC